MMTHRTSKTITPMTIQVVTVEDMGARLLGRFMVGPGPIYGVAGPEGRWGRAGSASPGRRVRLASRARFTLASPIPGILGRVAAASASVAVGSIGFGCVVRCDRKDVEANRGCQDDRSKGKPHLPLRQFVLQ